MSLETAEPLLLTRQDGGVLTVTLNRPAQFNPLSVDMMDALQGTLDGVSQQAEVRVLVIEALGKAFCAGHDLREMCTNSVAAFYQAMFNQCAKLMLTIQRLPVPVIAKVNGVATAGGCQLVASCDLAVASEGSRFAVSGVNLGLFCSTPAVPLSRNMSRKEAFEMLVTGDFISAQEARQKGLVNRVVPAELLDAEVAALCQSIVAKPSSAVALGKELFYRQLETGMEAAYQMAGQVMTCNLALPDTVEGLNAFIEKRPPSWKKP